MNAPEPIPSPRSVRRFIGARSIAKAPEAAGQISMLFRLTTVLHGLTDLGAISSALLSTLITEEGLAFDRAALFLRRHEGRRLRGYEPRGSGSGN